MTELTEIEIDAAFGGFFRIGTRCEGGQEIITFIDRNGKFVEVPAGECDLLPH